MCYIEEKIPVPVPAVQTPGQHSQFMRLSTELLHLILDHLDCSAWLHPLLLVSKDSYELTLSHLYPRFDWSVQTTSVDYRLLQMLDKNNRGLSYIRQLVLWDDGELSREPTEQYEYPEAALLVYLLPKDILTNFQWCSWHSMPSQIYRTLLSRQRTLTSLELNCSEIPIDDMLGYGSTSLLNSFEKVDVLRIMPGIDESMPRAAYDFFRNHPEIRHLVLRFWHMKPIHGVDQEQNAPQTSKGDLKAFFTGLEPSTFCLHTLDLADVDLRGCHCEWISALNFDKLSDLTLSNCIHPQDFLKAMIKATKNSPLHLKNFLLYQSQEWNHDPGAIANPLVSEVNKFLDGIAKSLRDIWICLRGFDELPDAASIAQHGKTLKCLFIDVRKQKGPLVVTYPLAEWQMLCRSLDGVRQVDVVYPSVDADCRIRDHQEFYDYVHATTSIPSLKFLGVNNWPFLMGTRNVWDPLQPNPTAYRHLLARLATDILDLSKPDLAAVVFGILEKIAGKRNQGFGLSPMHFGKSRVEVLGGEWKMKMEPVKRWILDRQTEFERKEYDIDGLAHEIGQWEAGDVW